jgi:A/G-specific adenine glycosylase
VHVFSHYRLQVEPLLFDEATAHQRIADNPSLRWCDAGDRAALGLPAPVRSLLQDL